MLARAAGVSLLVACGHVSSGTSLHPMRLGLAAFAGARALLREVRMHPLARFEIKKWFSTAVPEGDRSGGADRDPYGTASMTLPGLKITLRVVEGLLRHATHSWR